MSGEEDFIQQIKAKIPFVPTFNADRPFVFLVKDNASNTILFMGMCSNPAE